MKVSEILERAADIIDRQGWCKRAYYERHTNLDAKACPVDISGAINVAQGRHPGVTPDDDPAVEAVARFYGDTSGDARGRRWFLHEWNDALGSAAEAVAGLRKVALAEAEAGR
jgi:hypothetical protein